MTDKVENIQQQQQNLTYSEWPMAVEKNRQQLTIRMNHGNKAWLYARTRRCE